MISTVVVGVGGAMWKIILWLQPRIDKMFDSQQANLEAQNKHMEFVRDWMSKQESLLASMDTELGKKREILQGIADKITSGQVCRVPSEAPNQLAITVLKTNP